MPDKKLTDNEIIKALEDEIHLAEYVDSDYCSNVKLEIIKSALDLITCQQAKIDDLMARTAVTTLLDVAVVYTPTLEDYNKFKKKIKSESAKEFAERIKELIQTKEFSDDVAMLMCAFVENIVKEMVGEDNA